MIGSNIFFRLWPITQGTCTTKLNSLEVATESCKAQETGGVRDLGAVFEKAARVWRAQRPV